MKKAGIILLSVLVVTVLFSCAGHTKPGEDPASNQPETGEETDMISLKKEYGQIFLEWPKTEGITDPLYEVSVETSEGKELYRFKERSESVVATGYAAYAAQENDYYGEAVFHVFVRENGTVKKEYVSESFLIEDFFPKEKELIFGEDLKPDDLYLISYSGNGEMASDNFNYSLSRSDEEVTYSASWIDGSGHHEVERTEDLKVWEEALGYLANMKIERRELRDPEIQMLDGKESHLSVDWMGRTGKYSYYTAVFPKEDEEALIRYLRELA
ncbi:MAG: hypothetical protein IIZ33_02415 [Erysipelotrichaceae bacterium]|nr:hypothetical protein [Erysipelotrichaceae bacterium]